MKNIEMQFLLQMGIYFASMDFKVWMDYKANMCNYIPQQVI
jgi:hypothetical protein